MFLALLLSLALIVCGFYAVFVNMVRMTLHPVSAPFSVQASRGIIDMNLLGAHLSIKLEGFLPAGLKQLKREQEMENQ
jgi:hypothetical protein